jgi:YfiH family protein
VDPGATLANDVQGAIKVQLPGATALYTTRAGGVSSGRYASLNLGPWTDDDQSAVIANRQRLSTDVGLPLAQGFQVHGTAIKVWGQRADPNTTPEVDGHVTARRDIAPIVLVADCLPIVLSSESAIAVVHAGWRGIVGGVIEAAIRELRALGTDDDTLHASIGPGAGPCCYEVGGEAKEGLKAHLVGNNADLKAAAGKRIADCGADSVQDVGLCTMCDDRFFSHRRDGGITGRQAGIAWRL